jgi:hypothetical protein
LQRMLVKIDGLCAERDRLKAELPPPGQTPCSGRQEVVVRPARFFDEPELSPFLNQLNKTREMATREGWCYRHVQALIVAIDQYAEAAPATGIIF